MGFSIFRAVSGNPEAPGGLLGGAEAPRGALEAIEDGCAVGWAYDPCSPGVRLALKILVDGQLVAETIADLWRSSLAKDGNGDGCHGFVVELPLRFCDDAIHAISILLPGGETLLTTRSFVRAGANVAMRAGRMAQIRPNNDSTLSRREPREGFTTSGSPETIVLSDEMDVEVAELTHFAVQPGVADPAAERRLRFDFSRRYSVPWSVASRLPHGIVDTGSFLIMPTEDRYLAESVRHPGILIRWDYEVQEDRVLRREIGEIPERPERVVVLGAQSNANYSHWLLESLVRVLLFRPLDDGTRLYLTPPLTEWQRETLALAGIGPERILEIEPQGHVRFSEVISVSRGMGALPALRPAGVSSLAELAPPSSGARRIYCSRSVARYRHVTNETDMSDMLARHGFESVCPETLSVEEQIETFAEAEAVFALHGSGLTNIAFSRPGTLVIELQPEQFGAGGALWNWILASMREQPFAQVVCPLADASATLPHAHRDVTVDVAGLDELLHRILPG